MIEERQELAVGHKMKEHQVSGKPYWICEKCSYGTELEFQAKEHEAQPI